MLAVAKVTLEAMMVRNFFVVLDEHVHCFADEQIEGAASGGSRTALSPSDRATGLKASGGTPYGCSQG